MSSTDASYVAAQLYQHVYDWQKLGITTYVHAGEWLAETDVVFPETKLARWGMHAKTQVYKRSNGNEVMVGTYNLDNRSNHYNTEMGLFCKGNNDLVQAIESSILSRYH